MTGQLRDGASDTSAPRFDKGGKYPWFLARTDVWLGANDRMTSIGRASTGSVSAAVLKKDQAAPVALESDEEGDAGPGGIKDEKDKKDDKGKKDDKDKEDDKGDKDKPADPVDIDFAGIDQRTVALPIDRANHVDLEAGAEGVLFLLRLPTAFADDDLLDFDDDAMPPLDVLRFDLKKRKTEPFADRIDAASWGTFLVSNDRKKVLFAKDRKWFLVGADDAPKAGDGVRKGAGDLEVWVDPRADWRHVYHEVWRIERDFLYDPHAHGLDLSAGEALRALARRHRGTRRPERLAHRGALEPRPRPRGVVRGDGAASGSRRGRSPRGRLHGRGGALPLRAHPPRRELEPEGARSIDRAQRRREGGGLPARGERLVGIGGYPRLIDGGGVTAPRWALFGTSGKWEVENHGVAPDVEVEQDPALVRQGHDPQLERAVQPPSRRSRRTRRRSSCAPPYPDYGPRLPGPAPSRKLAER